MAEEAKALAAEREEARRKAEEGAAAMAERMRASEEAIARREEARMVSEANARALDLEAERAADAAAVAESAAKADRALAMAEISCGCNCKGRDGDRREDGGGEVGARRENGPRRGDA